MEEVDFLDNENSFTSKILVKSPAGADVALLHESEKTYYEQVSARYQKDNIFPNISDLQELDRILTMETMVYRWSQWILEEKDYFGDPVDLIGLQRQVESYSKEIRGLKKDLGIDKSSREKGHGESFASYVNTLKIRAKEFGVVRNEQAVKAITLFKEIEGKLTLYRNYSDDERKEFKFGADDFIEWLESKIPEFNKIDEDFRKTSQKYWIREQ